MANEEIKALAQVLGTWLKEDRGRLKKTEKDGERPKKIEDDLNNSKGECTET